MERDIHANCVAVIRPPSTPSVTARLNGSHQRNLEGVVAPKGRGDVRHLPEKESRPRLPRSGSIPVLPQPLVAQDSAAATQRFAAANPDARPRRLDTVVRAAAHAVVLASVVGFVLFYCVWTPLRGRLIGAFESGTVMTVADPLCDVRAPEVAGVFRAARPLPNGAVVRKGQLLGTIEVPQVARDLERAESEARILQLQQLQLEERHRLPEPGGDRQEEARVLASRIEVVNSTIQHLRGVQRQLRVYAPADGFVQQGLPATSEVKPHQTITSVYPRGADLVVEVTAPLTALNALQRRDRITAEFAMPGGKVKVYCRPNSSSVRHFKRRTGGGEEEIWGVLQCTPVGGMPDGVRLPGLLGRIAS